MPLRCLLVDDNEAFLEAASLLLEREGLTVVGLASSIAEALRQARALRPDVILQICRTCPVCAPCLRWALASGDAGIWGGTTEDERCKHRQSGALSDSRSAAHSRRIA
jgi:predicted RecB family nuclease